MCWGRNLWTVCVRDSSFLSVLSAVPGVRGGHETVLTPAHSPLFQPLHLQPSLSVTSLLLLLSLPSCHYSPSIVLPPPRCSHYFVSSFVSLSFCPVCPSSLSFCLISSISQSSHVPPLRLFLSSLTVLEWLTSHHCTHSHRSLTSFPHPSRGPQTIKLWWDMPALSFIICLHFAFRGSQLS